MEQIIGLEQPLFTTAEESSLRKVLAGLGTTSWLAMGQVAGYVARMLVSPTGGLGDAVICFGVVVSAAGMYNGLKESRESYGTRGTGSLAVGMMGMLFWSAQLLLGQIGQFK